MKNLVPGKLPTLRWFALKKMIDIQFNNLSSLVKLHANDFEALQKEFENIKKEQRRIFARMK